MICCSTCALVALLKNSGSIICFLLSGSVISWRMDVYLPYTIIAVCLAVAVAVYLNYPAPKLSDRVKKWKDAGHYITFKGHKIFYTETKGTGRDEDVVVLLHGFPSSSYDFNKILSELSSMFGKVISMDFLGYGLSDKPQGYKYSIMDQADSVLFLLKKLGHEQCHILAHDLGDTVTQELIHRHIVETDDGSKAELEIKSVCLMNGGIIPDTHMPRPIQKMLLNPWLAPIVKRATNNKIFKKSFGEVFGNKTKPTEDEFDDHYALMRYNDGYLVTNSLIQYIPQRFQNRNRWISALQDTKIPLHLIYGPADLVNPAHTFLPKYREIVPQSGVSELDAHISHYPHLEDPQGVILAYRSFQESLTKTSKEPST